MIAKRGMRDKLEKYFDINQPLKITLQLQGAAAYKFCCFGVNGDGKISDDRYMIFYKQLRSPNDAIVGEEISSGMEFVIRLNELPAKIQKLIFTGSIEGAGIMNDIVSHQILIGDKISAEFGGEDFDRERAIISLSIYRKNGWRFKIVARGFNGGLKSLLEIYGGKHETVAPSPSKSQSVTPAPQKISLEKKIQTDAPKLISLVKPLKNELKKRNLSDVTARVTLVMDISGSMGPIYRDGTVQLIVNKILPVAIQFDDKLDFWYYGNTCEHRPAVNLKNYKSAVPGDWFDLMKKLGYGNNEPVIIRKIIDQYKSSKLPAYVVFVTDGSVRHSAQIENLLIESSYLPIFWQFVGVKGSDYGILENLDSMKGRYVDNADFFSIDDFRRVSNEEFYSQLFNKFPLWLKFINGGSTGTTIKISASPEAHEKSFLDEVKELFGL